jgi:hypothetical protein
MLDELAQRAPDPAAALRLLDERRIVAFDVGGGTTDYVSIAVKLEAAGKNGASRPLPVVRTRVEGLSGDFDFGGDMITNAVIFLIKQTIEGQFGARVPTAAGGAAAEPVWRDNFFALFRIAESVKVRMSKGAPRVLLRDVLSELPGPLRAVSGDEPAVEEYDAARLSSALADVALTREAVDALVRPTIEQHVAGLARLCSTRPADVLVLAGNGVQYPLYGELFAAHRASILSPQGRILQPDGGGKLAVATGAYRTIINNLDGFRVAELKAASASPVACGDYYFLTTTGRMAQVPGLRQPFIRVGEPLDEVAGVVYDSGQERPPVRIPIGAFVVGRRLQGAPEGSAPVPIQLFYPAAEVPERPNGSEPRRAEPGRASRWAEVQQILDDAWVELKAAIDALAAAQTAQEASRVAALAQAWRRRPALDQPNEAVRLAECQHWLQVMLESYTAIRHVKQQRRLRYRKVRLRPELAERLRRCVDLLERISAEGVDEPPRPVPAGDPRAVFYRVQLMPDLSVTASFRGDHFEIPALSTGTPAQFYASASVFDMGTRPFER